MGIETEILGKKKSHRDRQSGRKADKKKQKNADNHIQELSDKQKNPKAFAINSAVRAERRFRRKQDIDTKKQHIPVVDRTPLEPPPILIAVVGPPKVGKSTLIYNLIKSYTKSPLTNIQGPVTIVTGKKRRITFIECNNDINCMIDIAKVADLVLLLCDASFGFEMEIFEFLNICQVHGMPRIMGVLTHLDMLKNAKALKRTKKTLKHRFWTEVYAGAKLFYLSGIIHGDYLKNEITNLGRFISIMKFRPLTWRSTHSYILADRYEDLTNPEELRQNKKVDRRISLYGYVRGVPLNKDSSIHLAGVGDFKIHDVSFLPDPCPLPDQLKKRSLLEKERLIYAPFSGVGGIVYDKDAVYVDLGGSHSHNVQQSDRENNVKSLVENMTETKQTLDAKIEESELQIFTDSSKIKSKDVDNIVESTADAENKSVLEKVTFSKNITNIDDLEDDLNQELNELRKKDFSNLSEERVTDSEGRVRRKVIFKDELNNDDDSSDDENDEDDKKIEDVHPNYKKLNKNKDENVLNKIKDTLRMFDNTTPISKTTSKLNESDSADSESDENDLSIPKNLNKKENKRSLMNSENDESDSEDNESSGDNDDFDETDDENAGELKWKEDLPKKARDAFLNRQNRTQNLMKLVYGIFDERKKSIHENMVEENEDREDDDIGGLFKVVTQDQRQKNLEKDTMNLQEISLYSTPTTVTRNWTTDENKSLIMDCFVTGKWKDSEDANELLRLDDMEDDDSEIFGDFEDLETGEKFEAKSSDKKRKLSETENNNDNDNEDTSKETLAEKKRRLKEKFDAEYDNGGEKSNYYDDLKILAEKQSQLNKSVFEDMADDVRVQLEGYRAGMYVRIEFEKLPCEFVENFDPTYPLLIGGLNMGEENIGYVNVKIKKHRWYKKILKTKDPVILSLGWRRFQTIPLYSKLEDDLKYRYLKYTPEHVTCNAHFWGPITPQGTGFLAIQDCSNNAETLKQGFRIAATGSVQELDKSTQIMKKLKLVGTPLKIYKKTAFIQGMFNTALEVAKFEGAKIKTVSGIRGMIKKAANKPEGCFRATFEDKILLSDIVFCRTWFNVDVPQFYNPVTNLLLKPEEKSKWCGMKTTGQLKREQGIQVQPNPDHLYTEIVRQPKVFKPLVIPKSLQKALPYRDKPKLVPKLKKKYEPIAVIREPYEQKVSTLMKRLKTTYVAKQEKLKQQMSTRIEAHAAEMKLAEEQINKKQKLSKKQICREKSKAAIVKSRKENRRSKKLD
ncbi:ribosome biogenesis protein BMS1 homolog [Chrysoperla carnea]|uniref:ribosome biogenesis protein BMS1 homolog n=1 Tax=Chrysoperla carnea TaxID=189513 RepID=UPI001D07DA80|nr:ribosome biogenesis protein BMS1 homolog [Chrysoperla carnea]